ncbi:MAG: hypothetical protein R3358_10120 [Woeseiaceae bacterium]|nr:hypothetical protein [Woeseiaceae bacterium]
MKILILLLLLAVLAGWYFLRRGGDSKPAPAARPDRRVSTNTSSKYHAVAIKFPSYACDAAKSIAGKRFLSSEAPPIPLPDCDGRECECTFLHFKDRRTGKDRRSPFTPAGFGSGTGNFETERRAGRDRRGGDIDFEL